MNRESRMSKETFPGDYSYLRVPTSGWMIPEVFPHKICPLRTPWKSGLPSEVTFIGRVKDVGIAEWVEIGVQPRRATITVFASLMNYLIPCNQYSQDHGSHLRWVSRSSGSSAWWKPGFLQVLRWCTCLIPRHYHKTRVVMHIDAITVRKYNGPLLIQVRTPPLESILMVGKCQWSNIL